MSQARNYNRSLMQAKSNSTQTKIVNRYFKLKDEYSKLPYEELDALAKDVYEGRVKLSKTDKQALYDVYRPQLMQKAQEEFAAKMANQKEETTEVQDVEITEETKNG